MHNVWKTIIRSLVSTRDGIWRGVCVTDRVETALDVSDPGVGIVVYRHLQPTKRILRSTVIVEDVPISSKPEGDRVGLGAARGN